jgi:hypothetical protein
MAGKKKIKQTQKQKQTVSQKVIVNVGTTTRRKKRTSGGGKKVSGSPMGKGLSAIQGGIVSSGYSPYEVNQLIRSEVQRLAEAQPTLQQIVGGPKTPLVKDAPTIAVTSSGSEPIKPIAQPFMPPLVGGSSALGQQVSFDNAPMLGHGRMADYAFTSPEEEARFKMDEFARVSNIEPIISPTGEALLPNEDVTYTGSPVAIKNAFRKFFSASKEKGIEKAVPETSQPATIISQTDDTMTIKVKRGRGRPKKDGSPPK